MYKDFEASDASWYSDTDICIKNSLSTNAQLSANIIFRDLSRIREYLSRIIVENPSRIFDWNSKEVIVETLTAELFIIAKLDISLEFWLLQNPRLIKKTGIKWGKKK